MQQDYDKSCADEKEKFEMLMEASPDCIKLFNLDNKIEYMSPGGLKEHHFKSLEDAIGFDWTETVVPEQREEIRQMIAQSIKEKKSFGLDVKHLPESADREWCHFIVNPVFDKKGEVKYFVGISRDISERKQSEEILQKNSVEQDRMNKVMMGRELKMIELKKENMALKRALEMNRKENLGE
ncbi:MAG: PAS domain S-box protein [Candidatus Moraniibacteriota bacterium]